MTTFRRAFARLCVAYGLIVGAFSAGQCLIPDTWSVIGLYATGAHLLLLGAVILLPIVLLIGQPRRAALALVPVVLIFMFFYGQQFIPSRATDSEGGKSIRVMTYNILWRDSDYLATVDLIRAADADVVALQEINPESENILREALADDYPYMMMNTLSALRTGEIGLLSRFPIIESATFNGVFNDQRVLIDVDGTPLVIYNMHAAIPRGWTTPFVFNIDQRTSDINGLIAAVKSETERVIVMGDFNMTDLSDSYQDLTAVLVDSYRQVGWAMGWTHAGPLVRQSALMDLRVLRLDYIFVSPTGLRPLNAMVWHESGGSDHLPVVATIEVRDLVGNGF